MAKPNKTVYLQRINKELDVINKNNFNEYFLILADLFEYAHQNGIARGCGRGSSVGSLLAMLLDITLVDPIEWDLQFERFLSPEMGSSKIIVYDEIGNKKEFSEDARLELKNGSSKFARDLQEGDEIIF